MRELELWRVEFNRYSYHPLIAVPPGMLLDHIGGYAHDVMEERFGKDAETNLHVIKIERQREVNVVV